MGKVLSTMLRPVWITLVVCTCLLDLCLPLTATNQPEMVRRSDLPDSYGHFRRIVGKRGAPEYNEFRRIAGKRAKQDYNSFRRIVGKRSRLGFTKPRYVFMARNM